MKTSDTKTTTAARQNNSSTSQPFFQKEGQGDFFSEATSEEQPFFQPKLTIGKPNDKYEQEADATADRVVRQLSVGSAQSEAGGDSPSGMSGLLPGAKKGGRGAGNTVNRKCAECGKEEQIQKAEGEEELAQPKLMIQRKPIFESNADSDIQRSPLPSHESRITNHVQTKCADCEQKEKLQKKEEEISESQNELDMKPIFESNDEPPPEENSVQTKSDGGESTASPSLQSRLNSSKGGGQPLPSGTSESMGSAMGADFSGVRVHTGSEAVQMNQELGAQAFTHGSDVYFNEGKYNTGSSEGQHLLAHELTHTVQQGGAKSVPNVQAAWYDDAWDATTGAVGSVVDAGLDVAGDVADAIGISIDDLREYLADFVDKNIPAYSMLSVAIGYDLLRGKTVPRTMDNILKGVFSLINPLGSRMYELLKENKIVNDAYTWISDKLSELGLTYSDMSQKLTHFLDNVILATTSPIDDNIGLFKQTFGSIFSSILTFIDETGSHVFELIKQAFLDILVSLAKKLGGYDLLCDLLGYDIITKEDRNASTADILRGILKLPIIQAIGGDKLLAKLEEHNLIDKTANWIDEQWALLKGGFADLVKLKDKFLNGFSMETLWKPMEFVMSIKDEVFGFVNKIITFFKNLATKALEIIKEALVWVLKKFVNEKTYGFELVKVLLGKDPFTNEPYPRTAENIICAFLKLLPSGEALCEKMKETGAIQKTTQWIMGAIAEFVAILGAMKEAFIALWKSASIDDLFDPIGFFMRIVNLFKEPVLKLVAFVKRVLTKIFEILLQIMQFPANMAKQIIENIKQAFEDIKRDPIGFLMKMLEAVKEGFSRFFDNIGKHLLAGVSGWLFGQVAKAGITPPKDFSLGSILDFVLQILDLTVERLWAKLAEKIGQDKVDKIRGAIDKLKGVWLFVKDVVQNGFSAVWKYIKEKISNLWNIVLEEVKSWAITQIIEKVVTKLLSMLDPTGIMAVVNGFMAFFKAIQSFMEYFKQMLEIVNTFVGGMAEIAKGVISKAAEFLENGLARAIPVALGFLANQVGLGSIGDKLKDVVGKIRGFINKALDWLIEKAMAGIKSIMGLFGKGKKSGESEGEEEGDMPDTQMGDGQIGKTVTFNDGKEGHRLWVEDTGEAELMVASGTPKTVTNKLSDWEAKIGTQDDWSDTKKEEVRGKITSAKTITAETNRNIDKYEQEEDKVQQSDNNDNSTLNQTDDQIESNQDNLKTLLIDLFKAFNEENNLAVQVEKGDKIRAPYNSDKKFHGVVKEIKDDNDNPDENSVKHQFNWSKLKQREQTHNFTEFNKKWDAGIIDNAPPGVEHSDYKPQDVTPSIEGDYFVLTYNYGPENLGRDELIQMEVKMKVDDVEKDKITHQVTGRNIAIKDVGSRGKVHSAGQIKNEDLDTTDLPQLNAAHILADWFNGSGFKEGLNLILTSDTYNQEVMFGAEQEIHDIIEDIQDDNPESLVTFDLKVTAIYETTGDDKVVDILKSKKPEMKEAELKAMHTALAGKQDPRRCESVTYSILSVKIDGNKITRRILPIKIGEDKYL